MLRKFVLSVLLVMLSLSLVGCSAHTFTVGTGAAGSAVTQMRQWYILYGLVPLNQVNSETMVSGTANYSIHTEQSPIDIIMNIFTGWVTINSRTITVTK